MIGALGAADRLVAVSSFCIDPPQVMKLPRIGGLFDVNLELVLRLQPDLIVLRGDHRAVQELCERNRIPIYRDRTNTFDDIFQTLGDLGELLDATDRAEQIAAAMHERLAKIESALAPLPRPRVFVTLSRNPDTLAAVMTAGQNTFVDEIIRRAGGINVFADASLDYPQVSPEAVLAARPDVIIECMPEVAITDALRDKVVKTWRPLAQLPAVASGRIHLLDLPHALIPSHRVVDTVAAVARILHPEAKLD
ncbi:MAG: cobalamin-binding protein [Phycisphaerae bacterium]|nr:MAG: cobalamin-binding protein [Phycisphaerae bacterium]